MDKKLGNANISSRLLLFYAAIPEFVKVVLKTSVKGRSYLLRK